MSQIFQYSYTIYLIMKIWTEILFLPKRLSENVVERCVQTRDGSSIKVKITDTNEVPVNSPQVVQLMGILFRRQLRHLKMQFVGRHYFNPARKIDIHGCLAWIWNQYLTVRKWGAKERIEHIFLQHTNIRIRNN